MLEITGERPILELPIVKFPPFRLRAWLIEKDPVVWAHLLETYVQYFKFLNYENNVESLSESTFDHLCIFIRTYLKEMGEEEGKLLSLGVNSDVTEQVKQLRIWVFELIKKCGLMHLQIHGETVWNFVKYYVGKNPNTVRSLLDGTLKPEVNTTRTQLNWSKQMQQHLKQLLESGKFTRIDLKSFEGLLAGGDYRNSEFHKQFFTTSWVEMIEVLWNKGQGRASIFAKQVFLVSLISSPDLVIVNTVKALDIVNLESLVVYPLFGSLLLHPSYDKHNPLLKKELPFMNINVSMDTEVEPPEQKLFTAKQESITAILEIFPQLSQHQVTVLLQRYDNDIERLTNILFENPSIVDDIPKETKPVIAKEKPVEPTKIYRRVRNSSKDTTSDSTARHVPDELRNKTLTRALQLLYENDEDERDDTYDESEVDRTNLAEKITIDEALDEGNKPKKTDENKNNIQSQFEANEGYLWDLLKQDKDIFSRSRRGSKERKNIKKNTNWSDEQIEGWARMLEKSPQRARILEEKYMFRGNRKSGKTAYVKNRDGTGENTFEKRSGNRNRKPEKAPANKSDTGSKENTPDPTKVKRQQARNEKNKSSKANHNRKAGSMKKMSRAGGP
ncbi:RQC trigger complex subunit CUE3 [Nakaseomyces bracarensis]|uniref:RQC trigger complex subunit CUE3 n=1 Tax=Nakaseomyces bracarensis TaxID=273131 RepID=A0ABR4NPR3_9SACH